jgi:glucose-1-phosphate adenylyltransferase
MKRDVMALVQAGGQGGRMDVLTRERAKPALPFAGVHRLVDFPLSSLLHAGIADVWVSVEYQVASIDEYLSGGRPWDLDRNRGGFRRIVPQTGSGPATEDRFAFGNGDLLLRIARDLEASKASTLVVSSADHVFNTDLAPAIADHLASGAAATVLTAEVGERDAATKVTVFTDADGVVTEVEEKPEKPRTGTVLTEISVYQLEPLLATLGALRAELSGDAEGDDSGIGDFADHILPRLIEKGQVRAAPLEGYWRDLGRPSAYLEGHRDLLSGVVDVFDHPDRPVISKWPDRTTARIRSGALIEDSMVGPGCDIAGEVVRSVLGPGVRVEAGARVEDCVLFDDAVVRRGARVSTSLVDERSVIGPEAVVGSVSRGTLEEDHLVLVGMDSTVGKGVEVTAGSRLEPGTSA